MYTDGIIVSWNEAKGFGFAATKKSSQDVFIHISDFESSEFLPVVDQQVRFIVSQVADGKLRGEAISLCGQKRQRRILKMGKFVPVVLFSFTTGLIFTICSGKLPSIVGIYYCLLSGITYLSYARDKRAAQTGAWRTSEVRLQLQSLLGGWPGAWLAQVKLRHKSQKRRFKGMFYLTVMINLAGLSWLFSEEGRLLINTWAINLTFFTMSLSSVDFIQLWWWKLDYWLSQL